MAQTYSLSCKEMGVSCPFTARGASEDEVINQLADHAQKVHGYQEITKEMKEEMRKKMKKE